MLATLLAVAVERDDDAGDQHDMPDLRFHRRLVQQRDNGVGRKVKNDRYTYNERECHDEHGRAFTEGRKERPSKDSQVSQNKPPCALGIFISRIKIFVKPCSR